MTNPLNQLIKEWIVHFEKQESLPFKVSVQPRPLTSLPKKRVVPPAPIQKNPLTKTEKALSLKEDHKTAPTTLHAPFMRSFFETVFPHLNYKEPISPIVLMHPPLNERERPVVGKLCKALSNHLVTAEYKSYSKELFNNKDVRLFLAPIPLLEQTWPQFAFKLHTLSKEAPLILPLAPLGQYLNDGNLKRNLWQTITSPHMRALLKLS